MKKAWARRAGSRRTGATRRSTIRSCTSTTSTAGTASEFNPGTRYTSHVVDYSQLAIDLANNTLPDYVFITPDLDDDMHDGTIAEGDAWLAREVPKLLASPAFQHGGVIFLLWDEGSGTPAGDDPPFIAISPNAKVGYTSTVDYDTRLVPEDRRDAARRGGAAVRRQRRGDDLDDGRSVHRADGHGTDAVIARCA